MKLSTRARYGTRALLDLALHYGEGPVLLKDIARREHLSLSYLEHIITPLILAGIIRSARGVHGGVSLLRRPAEIKLSEVIQLLEGSVAPVKCVDEPKTCPRSDNCTARDIWSDMKKAMDNILESTTLQDLAERKKKKEQPKTEMYYI